MNNTETDRAERITDKQKINKLKNRQIDRQT